MSNSVVKKKLCITFAARPLSREITMSQAYQNMCAGMYKVMYNGLLLKNKCMKKCASTFRSIFGVAWTAGAAGGRRAPLHELPSAYSSLNPSLCLFLWLSQIVIYTPKLNK